MPIVSRSNDSIAQLELHQHCLLENTKLSMIAKHPPQPNCTTLPFYEHHPQLSAVSSANAFVLTTARRQRPEHQLHHEWPGDRSRRINLNHPAHHRGYRDRVKAGGKRKNELPIFGKRQSVSLRVDNHRGDRAARTLLEAPSPRIIQDEAI